MNGEKVQLRKGIIIDGILYRVGSIVERDLIPEALRKRGNYYRLDEDGNVILPVSRIVPPPEEERESKRLVRKRRKVDE